MCILADIYLSSDDESAQYDKTPEKFVEREQYKQITPLELSTAWAIMLAVEWDVALLNEFPCVLIVDDGERLIHKFCPEMVAELAKLTPDQISVVAQKWNMTEELADWSVEDAREVFEKMVQLACLAIKNKKSLFLWNSV